MAEPIEGYREVVAALSYLADHLGHDNCVIILPGTAQEQVWWKDLTKVKQLDTGNGPAYELHHGDHDVILACQEKPGAVWYRLLRGVRK